MNREEDVAIALLDTTSKGLAEELTLRRRGGRSPALRIVSDARLVRACEARWCEVAPHLPRPS